MDPDDMFIWIDEGYDRGVWYCPATGEIIYPYGCDDWADYAYEESEYQESLWDSGYYE